MAVFTELTAAEVSAALSDFEIGKFVSLEPISSGIENTNYFLDTDRGRWVLTVFERLSETELPYYLELTAHLAECGLAVAEPQRNSAGNLFSRIKGKPFAIAERLTGESIVEVTAAECASMGEVLASMHIAALGLTLRQENLRGLDWWKKTAPLVEGFLEGKTRAMLVDEVAYQDAVFHEEDFGKLTETACHCDLFRNNAMITGHGTDKARVTGVFDFYFAGTTAWLFDLAVTVNDWCTDFSTFRLDPERTAAFLKSYNAVRPLTALEKKYWKAMLRAAALRFWISRLYDFYLPREASLLKPHDPTQFEKILADRIESAAPWID